MVRPEREAGSHSDQGGEYPEKRTRRERHADLLHQREAQLEPLDKKVGPLEEVLHRLGAAEDAFGTRQVSRLAELLDGLEDGLEVDRAASPMELRDDSLDGIVPVHELKDRRRLDGENEVVLRLVVLHYELGALGVDGAGFQT